MFKVLAVVMFLSPTGAMLDQGNYTSKDSYATREDCEVARPAEQAMQLAYAVRAIAIVTEMGGPEGTTAEVHTTCAPVGSPA